MSVTGGPRSAWFGGAVVALLAVLPASAGPQATQILILHSYHQTYPWTDRQHQGFLEGIEADASLGDVSVMTESLDTKRMPYTAEYRDFFIRYLQRKYQGVSPGVIYCTDDNALRFMVEARPRLFPGVPVVFSGVNDLGMETALDHQGFVGVFEKKEAGPNLQLARTLRPRVGTIILVGDDSSTDRAIRGEVVRELSGQQAAVDLDVVANPSFETVVASLASRRRGVVVLTTVGAFRDAADQVVPLGRALEGIVRAGDFLVISMEDVYVRAGVLGGYVTHGQAQGRAAGRLAIRVLHGERPGDIPYLTTSPNRFMFDHRRLSALGVDPADLPADSIILNRPVSFYDQYRVQIWLAALFLVLESVVLVGLSWNVSRRRLAERGLRQAQADLERRVGQRTAELALSNAMLSAEVAERQQIEQALRRERDRAQTYLDTAGTLFLVLDTDLRVSLINRRGAEMLEAPEDRIVGSSWFDRFVPAGEREQARQALEQLMRRGDRAVAGRSVVEHENAIVTAGGKERAVRWHNTVLWGEDGQVAGVLSSGIDITERRGLEKQLLHSQKMEAIGTLAGGIAHDFNNILAALLGYATVALEDIPEGSQARDDIRQVVQAGHRAKELVRQILAFSRKTGLDRAPIRVAEVLRDAVRLLRASIPRNIEVVEAIQVEDAVILGNASQIHQVIINLCTNAYQAMEERGGTLSVTLSSPPASQDATAGLDGAGGGPRVVLTVRDTGAGMAPATLEHIFEPYFTTKSVERGSGLGLAVVHGIVTGHQGTIRVSSSPGQGSTFEVTFPRIAPEATRDRVAAGAPARGAERILFVDDEPQIVDVTTRSLRRLGYEVTATTSSQAALDALRARPGHFDLLVTDQAMPQMSGLELASRALNLRPGLPVVLCTGYSATVSEQVARDHGIREFVLKPVAAEELAAAVRRALAAAPAALPVE
jgi:PAS domain S-box-containing protein